ncbi:MAG TPA: lysophospholipid acyltransferase family protein [Usitatibacter sp.]|jgi:putative hemolysin|nr:lysophospholipid acyltransferase family protein [Usitatibacter sp.]
MLQLEEVIGARFPALGERSPQIARPMLSLLRKLIREDEANEFLRTCEGLEGLDFIDRVLEHFNFSYTVVGSELENIPSEGRVVIVANHPLGLLDGVALMKLVSRVRRDVKIVANDVLLAFKPLRPLVLPVVNIGPGSNRANVEAIRAALDRDEAVIIFPSGEVSRAGPRGIRDARWQAGFLRFAEAARAPVLPVHLGGRNSALFYGISTLFRPLSTIMLLREPHLQRDVTLPVRIGRPIPWKEIAAASCTRAEKAERVLREVYALAKSRVARVRSEGPIAHPEDRVALRRELQSSQLLGRTRDGKHIYLFDAKPDSCVMRELGRLREIAFRAVGEGTGRKRDIDEFDAWYRHVVLWDESELQVVGAYRVGDVGRIVAERGAEGLYTHTLFEFNDVLRGHFSQSLELGRSFVQPRYQGLRALEYLWYGIGAYLATRPDIRYLFGPVSLSAAYPEAARRLVVHFYRRHFGTPERLATPRVPYMISDAQEAALGGLLPGRDYDSDFRTLKQRLGELGVAVPTLYKQYADLCEEGGTRFLAFNVDPSFAQCIDGLVQVDLLRLKPGKRERYLGDSRIRLGPDELLRSA